MLFIQRLVRQNVIGEKRRMQKQIITENISKSLFSTRILVKWLFLGGFIGFIVGTVCSAFGHMLLWANDYRLQYPWISLFLPIGGLLIVAMYRAWHNEDDRGTNMVISSIHSSTGIRTRMGPLIFASTMITHLLGGSAGREGAAIQLGGSIANKLGSVMELNENDQRIIIMCGMSAGFSALFGAPMAAAIFSLEVISIGIMHYSALVPCVVASMTAHFLANFLSVEPERFSVAVIPEFSPVIFLKLILFAALAGGVSVLFCVCLHSVEHLYKRYLKNTYIRIFAGGCILILLSFVFGKEYLGSGQGIMEAVFHGEEIDSYAFLMKMLFTAVTLGAGFKGGEIVPSFCIGAAFGHVMSALFGLPVTLVAACGMVGVFCGVTNCPITSLLIAFEMFGFEGMPYYLTTIAVSYMLSGYYGLYRSQKIMYSKTEPNFINREAQ